MKSIAILLPAYNESITIAETIKSFVQALPEAEIIVIDNNSSDDTALIANKTIKELGCIGSVLFESKKGKGNAIRRAFLSIDADIYI
jgi:glycosyltransferase involved in cell wall biosynthesis